MKLLINASVLASAGGVALLENLLPSLLQSEPLIHILLYLNQSLIKRLAPLVSANPQITMIPQKHHSGMGRLFWEQVTLPGIIRRHGVTRLLSFGNTGPLFPGCHQVLYLQQALPYTNYQPSTHRFRWWWWTLRFRLLIGLTQLGSQTILVPTGWLISPLRRSILFLKPHHAYCVSPSGLPKANTAKPDQPELLETLSTWRQNGDCLLFYPCFLAPYKHLPYVIEAIGLLEQQILKRRYRLLLTFNADSDAYFPCKPQVFQALAKLDSQKQSVLLMGELSPTMVTAVYEKTDMVVFPSLVETMGLPLLEAIRHGLPVVACNTPFAQELCQEAALYADSADPSSMAKILLQLGEAPENYRQQAQKSQERQKHFSWDAHAKMILGKI